MVCRQKFFYLVWTGTKDYPHWSRANQRCIQQTKWLPKDWLESTSSITNSWPCKPWGRKVEKAQKDNQSCFQFREVKG